ncbi:hypothetical protein R3W88_032988 [Solanum pinnatisectum]|uniref:Uncharacterized protein n=1 Tax=Solanum pinnatisectum TaxID=50273 RepID=A0AAV9K294_9SOLN|nr:hypothetical protein R3W88_032988 [Solanum pinnatisectum]
MRFSRLSWPTTPVNSLGTSFILPLPFYILNYFQKAILITTSDEIVSLLCNSNLPDIETIEITNKHTCRVFSLTPFFQLPIGPKFPSPQERGCTRRNTQCNIHTKLETSNGIGQYS